MTLFTWSQTASDNDDADVTVNLREGWAPRIVNNSIRALMAAVAKYRDDMSGSLVTGGTSTAYTVSSNQVFTSLLDGITVVVRMNATNGANPTLNVDNLGARQIRAVYGTNIPTGSLPAGSLQCFTFSDADNAWIVAGRFAELANTNLIAPTGTKMLFMQTNAPTGWTKGTDQNDKALRIVSGTPGTGGSTAFSVVFASRTPTGTVEDHALTLDEIPLHGHPFRVRNQDAAPDDDGGFMVSQTGTRTNYDPWTGTPSDTNGRQIGGAGGDQPHAHDWTGDAMDFTVAYVDLIYATKD